MEDDSVLDPIWTRYAQLREQVEKRPLDHRTWALEEELNAYLDAVGNGDVFADSDEVDRWLDNLDANRRKKYRRRAELFKQHFTLTITTSFRTQLDELIEFERVQIVRKLTTEREFRVLCRRALEDTYEAIAATELLSVPALKTLVCRCRRRLRQSTAI